MNVKDAQVLRLVVDEAVNGLAKDYANWADARLVRANGDIVYLSDLPDDSELGLAWDHITLRLEEADATGFDDGRVSFSGRLDDQPVVTHFNFLAHLGDDLIDRRPVL